MRNLDEIVRDLPAERRAKVTARGQKLVAEEMALRHLREARSLTQQSMATLMRIDQAGISKIEKRSDMLISTMRSYVEAMGGSLKLTAEFADGSVERATLGELAAASKPETKRKAKSKGQIALVEA